MVGRTQYFARDAELENPFAHVAKVYDCIRTPITSTEMPLQFSLWRHYKGGLYVVLGMVWEPEATPDRVVYAGVRHGFIWVRSLKAWREEVEVNGMKMPRFQHFSGGEG